MSASIGVCDGCNVVLMRDGELVENRPLTMCSHLRGSEYVATARANRLELEVQRLTAELHETRAALGVIRPSLTIEQMSKWMRTVKAQRAEREALSEAGGTEGHGT